MTPSPKTKSKGKFLKLEQVTTSRVGTLESFFFGGGAKLARGRRVVRLFGAKLATGREGGGD